MEGWPEKTKREIFPMVIGQ